jgi:hypothetical protein
MLTGGFMLCILVHSSLQRVVRLHVILQRSSAQRVSRLKPALTWSPNNQTAHPSLKACIPKENHLIPGNCILADHYFSPVQGHLPHTFGKERHKYTCGSLFDDHASGKIFKFLQCIIQILHMRHLRVSIGWKQWHGKKASK